MNSIRMYSNGAGTIVKTLSFDGKPDLSISIPVRKSDLGEVVSSVKVLGDVSLPEPPSYTPLNAQNTHLVISSQSALKDTITKLAGAAISVTRAGGILVEGALVGAHPYDETTTTGTIQRLKIVISTTNGIVLVDENDLISLKFTDKAVQEEYDKALKQAFQRIKPDSSFVNLRIVPNAADVQSAVLRYNCTVGAWKPCYSFVFDNEGKARLIGKASVDNDTDVDWEDTKITVVTGEPIIFDTDLVEIRRPQRSKVNVVNDHAEGAVGVEEAINRPKTVGSPLRSMSMGAPNAKRMNSSVSTMECLDTESYGAENYSGSVVSMNLAAQPQAEFRESGDFAILTSPGVLTIRSKSSAIIPLFDVELDDAKVVLIYKGERRPYRAIRFQNTTQHTFGKGECEIEDRGDFQGKCILGQDSAVKPGEKAFLVHAIENGVKITKTASPVESRCSSIKIKKGFVAMEQITRRVTAYLILNNKPEEFELEIEHSRSLNGKTEQVILDTTFGKIVQTDTKNGWRLGVKIPQNGEMHVTVTEMVINQQAIDLKDHDGVDWLCRNIIDTKNPLDSNRNLQTILDLQDKADNTEDEIATTEERVTVLIAEQDRLVKLIPNGHQVQAEQWKTDLGENEKEIRELNLTTIPALKKRLLEEQKSVAETLSKLTISWTADKRESVNDT